MVFGGRVLEGPKKTYKYGVGPRALVFYDPSKRAWELAPPMPDFQGRVIAYHRRKTDVDRDLAAGTLVTPPIETNPIGAEFELPFGGADGQGRAHYFVARGSVYFDPRTRTWGQAESPIMHGYVDLKSDWIEGPAPSWRDRKYGATATGPDGKLYLVDGVGYPLHGAHDTSDLLAALDTYDSVTNVWKPAAAPKIGRQSLAAAFGANGKLYVFGGCSCFGVPPLYSPGDAASHASAQAEAAGQRHAVAETEVYDPKTDRWSMAAPMPNPRMLFAAAAGADGKIYLIGGQTSWGSEPLPDVDVYDPATDRWSRGSSLRMARLGHVAVTTGDGTIWVVGGYAAAPRVTEVNRILAGDKEGPTTSVELLKTATPH